MNTKIVCERCVYCQYPRSNYDNGGACKCKAMKRKTIDVYVVLVLNAFNNAKVSQEAYTSLAAAQEFCKGRADKPEQLTRYCFKSKVYTYQIYWTTLVLNCGG